MQNIIAAINWLATILMGLSEIRKHFTINNIPQYKCMLSFNHLREDILPSISMVDVILETSDSLWLLDLTFSDNIK